MFLNKLFSRAHISKNKTCFTAKSSAHYFHMKTKILPDFRICISVPLILSDFPSEGIPLKHYKLLTKDPLWYKLINHWFSLINLSGKFWKVFLEIFR